MLILILRMFEREAQQGNDRPLLLHGGKSEVGHTAWKTANFHKNKSNTVTLIVRVYYATLNASGFLSAERMGRGLDC